jgi:hypothetical protein
MGMVVSNKNVRIYVTVSKDTHNWLIEEAANDDRNVSNLVNVIIKQHIKSVESKKNLPNE